MQNYGGNAQWPAEPRRVTVSSLSLETAWFAWLEEEDLISLMKYNTHVKNHVAITLYGTQKIY